MLLAILLVGVLVVWIGMFLWRRFPRTCTWLTVFYLGAAVCITLQPLSHAALDVVGWAWLCLVFGLPLWWAFVWVRGQLRGE